MPTVEVLNNSIVECDSGLKADSIQLVESIEAELGCLSRLNRLRYSQLYSQIYGFHRKAHLLTSVPWKPLLEGPEFSSDSK